MATEKDVILLDDIFIQIGECGLYQKKVYSLIVISWIIAVPAFMMGDVFIIGKQSHR